MKTFALTTLLAAFATAQQEVEVTAFDWEKDGDLPIMGADENTWSPFDMDGNPIDKPEGKDDGKVMNREVRMALDLVEVFCNGTVAKKIDQMHEGDKQWNEMKEEVMAQAGGRLLQDEDWRDAADATIAGGQGGMLGATMPPMPTIASEESFLDNDGEEKWTDGDDMKELRCALAKDMLMDLDEWERSDKDKKVYIMQSWTNEFMGMFGDDGATATTTMAAVISAAIALLAF